MNTKAEIIDVLDGSFKGELPPPVILTQTGTVGMMERSGCHWPEAFYDTDKMVGLALQPHESFGLATARVPFDIVVQAEAIGCDVSSGTDRNQPSVLGSPWRTNDMSVPAFPEDIVSKDEMLAHPHIVSIIEAAERLHGREDLFVTSMCVCGGGMVMHMLGMENMLMEMMMDPEAVKGWVTRMTCYSTAYAKELSEVSDNVCVITDILSDIIPRDFLPFVTSEDRKVIQAIGPTYSMIHNCGNTLYNVDDIISMGSDIVSLEMSRSPAEYMRGIGGRSKVLGCISATGAMLHAGPDEIRERARWSAEIGVDLVGPECGLPPLTPDANVAALSSYRD